MAAEIDAPVIWQWDAGRSVGCADPAATEAHFARPCDREALVTGRGGDGRFPVPPSLLRAPGPLAVWVTDGERTLSADALDVLPRPRPGDYVDAPDEVLTVERVERDMAELREWVERKVQEGTGPRGSGISAGDGMPAGGDFADGDLYIDTADGRLYEYELSDL